MVKLLSKLTKREQVIEFCRRYGITYNYSFKVITLSSRENEWFELFESWDDAQLFLINAKLDKEDKDIKFPWAK